MVAVKRLVVEGFTLKRLSILYPTTQIIWLSDSITYIFSLRCRGIFKSVSKSLIFFFPLRYWPVMKRARSEQRKIAASATSAALPGNAADALAVAHRALHGKIMAEKFRGAPDLARFQKRADIS